MDFKLEKFTVYKLKNPQDIVGGGGGVIPGDGTITILTKYMTYTFTFPMPDPDPDGGDPFDPRKQDDND